MEATFSCTGNGQTSIDTAQAIIIIGTGILHNLAYYKNEIIPPIIDEEQVTINFVNNVNIEQIPLQRNSVNNIICDRLINNYFSKL